MCLSFSARCSTPVLTWPSNWLVFSAFIPLSVRLKSLHRKKMFFQLSLLLLKYFCTSSLPLPSDFPCPLESVDHLTSWPLQNTSSLQIQTVVSPNVRKPVCCQFLGQATSISQFLQSPFPLVALPTAECVLPLVVQDACEFLSDSESDQQLPTKCMVKILKTPQTEAAIDFEVLVYRRLL